ncbi:uncharacterized protein LOC117342924 [Pecten maximus]|uniref:uncharacterized protein LOC117342924 n=1 Tax=Pecten maximus TaxID=6579 RepID=UPI0014590A20|nr:uncharacterized protein LOC117342924 [Pecten maximus]
MACTSAILAAILVVVPITYASQGTKVDMVAGPALALNLKETISKIMKAREIKENNFKQGSGNSLKRMSDPSSMCFDNDEQCEFWAGIGECGRNRVYMLNNCKDSCGVCGCFNYDIECRDWAAQGECGRNPAYMIVKCRAACNACVNYKRDVTSSLDHGPPGTKVDSVEKDEKSKSGYDFGKVFKRRETWHHATGNGGPPGTR